MEVQAGVRRAGWAARARKPGWWWGEMGHILEAEWTGLSDWVGVEVRKRIKAIS